MLAAAAERLKVILMLDDFADLAERELAATATGTDCGSTYANERSVSRRIQAPASIPDGATSLPRAGAERQRLDDHKSHSHIKAITR